MITITTVYFVRHAEPDNTVHDDTVRPLTSKGMMDRTLVSGYLEDKNIQILLSSPYKRAYDTIADFSKKSNLPIETVNEFRERRIDSVWIEDFTAFAEKQWNDFSYRYSDGECLAEVQERNIKALNAVLQRYANQNIAIGSHGTAISTIINYYDNTFGFKEFQYIKRFMPWIVKLTFNGLICEEILKINLFEDDCGKGRKR